jgi:pimeloyl-ACP methyl ester carboxylesterase
MSKFVRVLLIVLAVVLLLVLVGPFLIPIRPLPDTQPLAALTPPESEFVAIPFPGTGGIRTHVRTSGDSDPTFVLLHGFAANLYTWDLVFDEFAENGRVLAYDRIPYGLSARLLAGDWSGPNPYTPEASIDQLIALLDAQGIERAVLVGNSAGGALAMRAALAYPERVQGLMLISAAVYTISGSPAFIALIANTPQMARLGPLVARLLPTLGLEESSFHDPAARPPALAAKAALSFQVDDWDKALWEATAASDRVDLTPRLAELTLPVLVVTGDDDRIVPTAESVRLAEELPNASLAVLPACGHVAQEECPAALMRAINDWRLTIDD